MHRKKLGILFHFAFSIPNWMRSTRKPSNLNAPKISKWKISELFKIVSQNSLIIAFFPFTSYFSPFWGSFCFPEKMLLLSSAGENQSYCLQLSQLTFSSILSLHAAYIRKGKNNAEIYWEDWRRKKWGGRKTHWCTHDCVDIILSCNDIVTGLVNWLKW